VGPFSQGSVGRSAVPAVGSVRATMRCYGCGQIGHMRRACPGSVPAGGGHRPADKMNGCFGCGKRGHIVRDCPRSVHRSAMQQTQPFCLGCGRSGHWLADCRLLAGRQSSGIGSDRGAGRGLQHQGPGN